MKNSTKILKLLCVFIIMQILLAQKSIAQKVLLHEGFEEDSTGWQIVNNGNNIWDVLTGGFNTYKGDRCMYVTTGDYGLQTDCWLISTPIKMVRGKKYSISFHYKNQTPQTNKLEVSIGRKDVTATGQVVWRNTFNNDMYATGQINFVCDETATKYLRFHCITPKMYTYLYFDEVTVEEVNCFEPLNVNFSNVQSNSITASWNKVDDAAYYEYSVFNKDTSVPKFVHSTKDTFVNIPGLDAATSDFFYVRSKCSKKDSSEWATAQFSTNYDCSTFPTLTCGTTIDQHYRGKTGLYKTNFCGQILSGPEFFHKFTPTQSGYYKLDCFSAGGNGIPVGFAYKESSLGCDNNNWNCIGVMYDYASATFGPLKAGVEYTIIEKSDLQAGLPSEYIFKVECYNSPPVNDSCNKAIQIPVTAYSDNCTGTALTTLGATPDIFINDLSCGTIDGTSSNDDDVWVKFKANNDNLLFRFTNVQYTGVNHALVVNFYSESCNSKSKVDCGSKNTTDGANNDILSYYFEKGKIYYARISSYGIDNSATFNLCIMKPGIANNPSHNCMTGLAMDTKLRDSGIWVPMLSDSLGIIGAVKFNNGQSKTLIPSLFINHGNLRMDGAGNYYLDRNFTIAPAKKSSTPFTVRLYFTKDELTKLINQPGSNVSSLDDINVTQTDAACSATFKKQGIFIVPAARGSYDSTTRYVEFTTDHLSSFFLHGGNKALSVSADFEQNNAAAINLKVSSAISISPNPFINQLYIEVNEVESIKYKITVTTVDARPVASFERMLNKGYNKLSFDLSKLTKGVYMLKIEKQSGIEVRKIIKQ
ncbi:MAG: T9SS type A sorting domain-containing protein [Parafilimonas sp.]